MQMTLVKIGKMVVRLLPRQGQWKMATPTLFLTA
jgi:hypothetical protein